MDKVKDPATILSVIANVGVVGSSAYFYKQLEGIQIEIEKLNATVTNLTKKLADMTKDGQHRSDVLNSIVGRTETLNQVVADLASADVLDDLDIDFDELIQTLEEHNIEFERPSKSQHLLRSGDRRDRRRPVDDFEDARLSDRRTSTRRTRRRDDWPDTRTPRRRPESGHRSTRIKPQPLSEEEDDFDLINSIRLQQSRR